MSRAAVLDGLRDDVALNAVVPPENIFPNYSREGRPSPVAPGGFIVLRWGGLSRAFARIAGPRDLTVWAHWPAEQSSDFGKIDRILERCKEVLCSLEDVVGGDGYTLTCVEYAGESQDMKDLGFETIMRNMTFRVLMRPT